MLSLAGEAGTLAVSSGAAGVAVSTVHSKLAGLWSALPATSIARTSNLWAPSARPARSSGEAQAAQSAASLESSRHWKEATPEPPASAPEKSKLAVGDCWSGPAGELSIWVVGAVVSTLQFE